jgi:sugar-phosphatase
MFVNEVTRHWFGLYPWEGPTPDEVAVTVVDRVIELTLTKGTLKPGAEDAIARCTERGWYLAVASSSQYRLIDAALGHFGLRGHFAVIHSAEEEQYGKPHPAVFLSAATRLGASPKRCLVWEDAPAGVLAAKAASMACIAVPEAAESGHPAFGLADLVVPSLLDVDDARLDDVERRSFAEAPR